ncbi:hypothetical protein [Chitinophaga nivalis]|uniref:DUF4304 domain-containing protein n=1 Tax=Chitinophaga nivalis TaxID=2991709 RepID=A0ABT3IIT1_9BACT|nr:hypothetical protein [Chitinophaga nivalis]MCW3466431.1 hypothetical protein [Chitinophaga nivalis]MCW3483878.1 hypothetical protein [Chitinophaga nivalis]
MTQKKLLRDLISLLQPKLDSFDFKPNLKEQGFYRKDGMITYYFYFLLYNRTNIKSGDKGFLIEPYIRIGFDEIERYYKAITVNASLTSEWNFTTIGNNIATFLANPDGINRKKNESLDLIIWNEEEIQYVATELYTKFIDVAIPYFLTNNSIEKVDELLNSTPREDSVHMTNELWRFIKGIIAAKLNKNPKLFQLIETYNSLIIEWDMDEDSVREMEQLKSILPEISR